MFDDGVLVDLFNSLGGGPLLQHGEEVLVLHLFHAVPGRHEVLDHALGDEGLGVDLPHEGQVVVTRLVEVVVRHLRGDPNDVPGWRFNRV